ncbi:2-amino-4-hydroxy-6-hydroxymethyldihydropteridinepyrophosphokinase [hydrothermal vent metagenome]|uniref:2-amino-4-hydroxy-6-hydroxymethyldihydropteridine diphosphokinase n=1 Tax=hydrothermal vent metagenome TaxID=652676 RepID=A0A1W1EKB5_9ZZZZ
MRLYKELDSNHTIIKTDKYPYVNSRCSYFVNRVFLGIGGNIGDSSRVFEHLFAFLSKSRLIDIVETSIIFKNPPFGYINQNSFYNSIILIKTPLSPKLLLKYIWQIEKRFKRKRSFANAPRSLDIDIIFYNNIRLNDKDLKIPHIAWDKRESVILPLSMMRGVV